MSLVREKVKAIVCLGFDNKKIIDVFGNVVDMVLEVTNMDDAVRMAQRLTERRYCFIVTACASFDLFEIMRIEAINLNKQFTIYKGGQYLLNIK
jgi:UDP-N-acetylmuramoylalanine--D-glutamate ligase